ncbi:GTP cyclohydrolase IIa [Ignicoccus hospitalis]|uniref:GTP cyclohydrolase Iia n=1 Tax=Ignicoccus hospitalis (strain KIN4/I / DSM 18386 / JCM 14125) TaxID=453591 RepID=A8AC76_IGNH4|nr:GTP cyclohydrolase IIa [Ignicoccus hospitalis]ABU82528.1 GTP cyclohydrolase Iia [Ignicoccus hospitalis KIN4/I]HIH90692.1 GTP cyclohydrolase IIa [Desulfurococcaceae archaeon]
MHKVASVVLEGYREWTESLGDDREWKIQLKQAEIDMVATRAAKDVGAFYIPTRKDVLFFVLNGVEDPAPIFEEVSKVSPVPISVVVGCGRTPLAALNSRETCKVTSNIAAIHIDINFFRTRDKYLGFVESVDLLDDILKIGIGYGSIGTYLGGDNIVMFSDPSAAGELARLISSFYDVKVGVGIDKTPRGALELAARALRLLREDRTSKVIILK